MKTVVLFFLLSLTQCALLDTSVISHYEQAPTKEGANSRPPELPRYTLQNSIKSPLPFEKQMIQKSDIYLGMNEYSVKASWGQPGQVESAGTGNSKFQRWIYKKMIPTATGYVREERLVFFEDGRVVGWETH